MASQRIVHTSYTVQGQVDNGEGLLLGYVCIALAGAQFGVDRSGAKSLAAVKDSLPVNWPEPSVRKAFKSPVKLVCRRSCGVWLTGVSTGGT